MQKETGLKVAELVLRIVGLLETILPAALVAYTASLKTKVRAARALQEIAETQRRATDAELQIVDETASLGRRALLDRAIRRARERAGEPPTG